MGIIEDIGETAIKLGSRAVYHLLGILIKAVKVGDILYQRLSVVTFYPIFEKRDVEYRDYVVLKTQTVTLLFLLSAVAYIFNAVSGRTLILASIISGGPALYLVFSQIKEHFGEDFDAYRDFFLSYLAISLLLIVVKRWKPIVGFAFPFAHLFIISILAIGMLSFVFRRKYGRDYTTGRVVEAGERVKVKVNYDIRAGVKPGRYTFDNVTGAKEGEVVKLKIDGGFLNLRGKKPVGVLKEENG
jgi:uncharacterized membrane protein